MTVRINVFDQDTLNALQAQGIEGELLRRVEASMRDSAHLFQSTDRLLAENRELVDKVHELREALDEAQEPTVVWQIPRSYAEKLVDHLHREMPGGYQAYVDDLREAIARA